MSEHRDLSDKILIVDDEDVVRYLAVDLLSNLGFETVPAADGQAAIEIAGEQKEGIDLVLHEGEMGEAYNVGTGRALTILDVAEALIDHLDFEQEPEVVGRFRAGDIRHCYADIGRLAAQGYRPGVRFEDGVAELVEWVRAQRATDMFEDARSELARRGLTT